MIEAIGAFFAMQLLASYVLMGAAVFFGWLDRAPDIYGDDADMGGYAVRAFLSLAALPLFLVMEVACIARRSRKRKEAGGARCGDCPHRAARHGGGN